MTGIFVERKFRRKEISPRRNIAVGNNAVRIFRRMKISPYKKKIVEWKTCFGIILSIQITAGQCVVRDDLCKATDLSVLDEILTTR